jgi:uncharacterized FAD-dependent dehydrogenase
MLRLNEVKLPLNHSEEDLTEAVISRLSIESSDLLDLTVYRRSYDARKKSNILLIYQLDVSLADETEIEVLERISNPAQARTSPDTSYHPVIDSPAEFPTGEQQRPIIIGFGPCGILAALQLAQMGLKPIVLERGQDVRQRTQDTWSFWRDGELNTESNVQFGEGGAGTFSDGKLYSQVKDPRFIGRKVLREFVKAGAPEEILFDFKPHIGTFKLVAMVERMRAEITRLGGEIRFNQKVVDLNRELVTDESVSEYSGRVTGVELSSGETLTSRHIILAVGHSARDTFSMLLDRGVYIEAKPFSIGLRIEHPQSVIDQAQFGDAAGNPILGAAEYQLVHHCKNGRSVYSFCMCPGGTVVAATSEEGRVVTNGMSQYSRNERNANSAIVVGITPEKDYPDHPLAGIDLQIQLEELAYELGGSNYNAPVQLVGDFLNGLPTKKLASAAPSYTPGVTPVDLSSALPAFVVDALREAILAFDKKIRGFAMYDALLTGIETRTSSPVSIKRDKRFQSINTRGLYPAGEGAGYAGGILSAGIDGIKVAEAVALDLLG